VVVVVTWLWRHAGGGGGLGDYVGSTPEEVEVMVMMTRWRRWRPWLFISAGFHSTPTALVHSLPALVHPVALVNSLAARSSLGNSPSPCDSRSLWQLLFACLLLFLLNPA